jgi:hypothetical protein
MKPACQRQFEVEAARDGRLQGAELARFRTHLGSCADCAREARALDALAQSLRAASDPLPVDQLHVRRERTRLLAAFDARLVPLSSAVRGQLWLGLAAGLLALAVLAAVAFRFWPGSTAPTAAPSAARASEPVVVRADSSARWSRETHDRLDTIVLQSGALSIRVQPTQPRRRLLVILPDGELEDIGTTFSVSADGVHTTRVSVQEGSVVLRLRGQPPLALAAGDAWSPPAPAPTDSAPDSPRAAAAAPPLQSSAARKASPSAPAAISSARDAAAEFRAAMSAFDSGDHARAVALFSAFIDAQPHDARAQDAAYLRVLALQRSGDTDARQRAARDYLARYPRGFRRAEVELLAR